MRKSSYAAVCMFLWVAGLFAQGELRYFELSPPSHRVPHSLYSRIDFLDSRGDTSMIGPIGVGLLKNRDARLLLKTPFLPELKAFMVAAVDSGSTLDSLLFQLRQFNFVETEGARYCFLCISLSQENARRYRKIALLDTLILLTSSDVVKALHRQAGAVLPAFLEKSLAMAPAETTTYSLQDIENIDSVDKRKIPLYNVPVYAEGIYYDYASFANQAPGAQATFETKKDGTLVSVRTQDGSGRRIKLKPKSLYAVVLRGKPFIATEYGYYALEKVNDNFIFTGDIRITPSNGDVIAGQLALGITGALLAKGGSRERYNLLIDYLDGGFIHQLRIKTEGDN